MMLALSVEIEKYQPGTQATIIAHKNAELIAGLATAYPFIKIVAIQKNISGLAALVLNIFRSAYLVFLPVTLGKGQILTLLSLRPGTKTFGLLKKEGDVNPYTHGFVYDAKLLHYDNMRRLAREAGLLVETEGSSIRFSFNSSLPTDFPYAPKSYIVLHPFGSSSWKSWPPRRARELLLALGKKYPQYSFVVTGGKENTNQTLKIVEGVPRTISALGLPILEAIGIIAGSKLFIGVDTGTMHLASVMQHDVIALAHNAGPEWLPLYNPNAIIVTNLEHCTCDGVRNDTCKVFEDGLQYTHCIYDISDEMIFVAVAQKLLQGQYLHRAL